MKITNQAGSTPVQQTGEAPLELKKGETYQASVKDRQSSDTAIVQIRGKEVAVKVEGALPAKGEQVTLSVMGMREGLPLVRLSEAVRARATYSDALPAEARPADTYSQEQGEVAKLLADKGMPMTKEIAKEIRRFLETANGNLPEKVDTLQTLIRKGLSLTLPHMKAVHEALHGPALSRQITELISHLESSGHNSAGVDPVLAADTKQSERPQNPSDLLRKLQQLTRSNSNLQHLLRLAVVQIEKNLNVTVGNPEGDPSAPSGLSEQLSQALQSITDGEPERAAQILQKLIESPAVVISGRGASLPATNSSFTNLINLITEAVDKESSLSKVVYQIKEQLLPQLGPSSAQAEEWNTALAEVRRLQLAGNTEEARERIRLVLSDTRWTAIQTAEEVTKAAKIPENRLRAEAVPRTGSLNDTSVQAHGRLNTEIPYGVPEWTDVVRFSITSDRSVGTEVDSSAEHDNFMPRGFQLDTEAVRRSSILENGLYAAAVTPTDGIAATRTVVVTQITQKLRDAANQFKGLQREMTRNLDTLLNAVHSTTRNVFPQVKALLESTIDILDKAILKSDLTLLTDMGTEKKLLTFSTRLADARKFLAQGNNVAAGKVLAEVKSGLEQMNWRPADVKIKHLLLKGAAHEQDLPTQKLAAEWEALRDSLRPSDASARSTFEALRSLGLNRDSEAAQWLASGKDGKPPETLDSNLKTVLLKLAQEDTGPIGKQADQALQHLTGQQLLSKVEPGSPMQMMMLNLPVFLSGHAEDMKVFVQSRNEGQKLDWENCSLYFALETRKLGELGILLTAADRRLTVTIKNDLPGIQEKMAPLLESCKQRLEDIGYRISGFHFTPLSKTGSGDTPAPAAVPSRPASPHPDSAPKGFDFKI